MTWLEQIRTYIEHLDRKQFLQYLGIFLAIIFLGMCFMMYRYYRARNTLLKKIEFINTKRKEVKNILEQYEMVKKQQADVDALLEKDKDFTIAGYFNSVITKLGLTNNKTREPETSSEQLDNGYTERKLYATFSTMNMKKLTELLDTLEQNERIYTKELEMYRPDQGDTINVNLLIATLEPKIEPEETE